MSIFFKSVSYFKEYIYPISKKTSVQFFKNTFWYGNGSAHIMLQKHVMNSCVGFILWRIRNDYSLVQFSQPPIYVGSQQLLYFLGSNLLISLWVWNPTLLGGVVCWIGKKGKKE